MSRVASSIWALISWKAMVLWIISINFILNPSTTFIPYIYSIFGWHRKVRNRIAAIPLMLWTFDEVMHSIAARSLHSNGLVSCDCQAQYPNLIIIWLFHENSTLVAFANDIIFGAEFDDFMIWEGYLKIQRSLTSKQYLSVYIVARSLESTAFTDCQRTVIIFQKLSFHAFILWSWDTDSMFINIHSYHLAVSFAPKKEHTCRTVPFVQRRPSIFWDNMASASKLVTFKLCPADR